MNILLNLILIITKNIYLFLLFQIKINFNINIDLLFIIFHNEIINYYLFCLILKEFLYIK